MSVTFLWYLKKMSTFDKQWDIRENDFKTHNETTFEYKGYKCEIKKSNGHWCGYVYLIGMGTV
jgi:hypothetical protein